MSQILELPLERVKVYCFENNQNHYLVENIIRGIHAGDSFAPLHMFKRSDDAYELINGCTYPVEDKLVREGGHHRTLAHYRAKKPLLVQIFTQEELDALVEREHFSRFSASTLPLSSLKTVKGLKQYLQIMSRDSHYRRNHCSGILSV